MGSRVVIGALLMASACGFEGGGNKLPSGGDDAGPTGTPDAPVVEPPVLCGDLVCDPHAECTTENEVAGCQCGPGYEGDGLSCHDIDECALAETDCIVDAQPGTLCQNTPGSHVCYTLTTCEEAKAHGHPDGEVVLHVAGDLQKPWPAYCKGSDTYLPLVEIGADKNYGQYTHNALRVTESDVRTRYTKVRIDPVTLIVDINDRTFATSTGLLKHSGIDVKSVAYGVGMDCINSTSGRGNIDLSGLPFKVALTQTFSRRGSSADGTAVRSLGDQVVDITGGGNCGWMAPTPAPNNPFNDFADNAKILQLTYSPLAD